VCASTNCSPDGVFCQSGFECCTNFCDPNTFTCGFNQCQPDGFFCSSPFECCTGVCTNNVCGAAQCKLDGFSCNAPDECCTGVCQSGICGAGSCLPPGSNCNSTAQCCVGLVCNGGHCGTPTVDAGACSLDPGGTPCSQCIVGSCCSQTENCLMNGQCAPSMSCFQRCTIGGGDPASCQMQCCTGNLCNQWAQCVAQSCAIACF
jgi:hypothetical protein